VKGYNQTSIQLDGSVKEALAVSRQRMLFVLVFFCLCFLTIIARLVDLSGVDSKTVRQHIASYDNSLHWKRASIVDRNGILLATNLKTFSLYANAKRILDPKLSSEGLVGLFPELDYDSVYEKLTSGKGFVWIKRNLHPWEQVAVNKLGDPGLMFRVEEKRSYPQGNLLAHILGVVGQDGHGLMGIERSMEHYLQIPERAIENPDPLQLTVDIRVQDILHEELTKKMEEHKAIGASGVVLDVHNGEVLAMVSLPDFDPNFPENMESTSAFNRGTLGIYEMGSTFKAFTMAMALDSGKVGFLDRFDATKPVKIGRFRIRDYHGEKREMNLPEIFMYSSNIGTAKIADVVGKEVQQDYLSRLGLLSGLDVELPERGTPLWPEHWGRVHTMTISYGHGIAVTPLHVAAAAAALVNGGEYRQSTLLKGQGGEPTRVISKDTSEKMRRLLRLVVADEDGTGGKAAAKGYVVGGKTGTAEKPGTNSKRYDKRRLVTSFMGAFPMDNPRYVVLTVMDEPKPTKNSFGYATAGWTAAPVVKNVVTRMAPVLGIAPQDEDSQMLTEKLHIEYKQKEAEIAAY